MKSLQQDLRRRWFIALLVALLSLSLLADYGVRQFSRHYVLSRLEHDAEGLIAAIAFDVERQQWVINTERLGGLFQRVYSGHYFAVYDGGDVVLVGRSLWDKEPPELFLPVGNRQVWIQPGILHNRHREKWLSLALGFSIGDHPLTLWVAEDVAPFERILNQYRLVAFFVLVLIMLLLMVVQSRQLRSVFSQLAPLHRQLRELRLGDRQSLSPEVLDCPEEVQPLVSEIGRLLGLLQERIRRSRNALGNLAHEIKRLLMQLQLLVEDNGTVSQTEQRDVLRRLQDLIQRELTRARIIGVSSPGRRFRLAEDIPSLVNVLGQLYPTARIDARFPPDGVMPQDRDDMLELLGNLLDNACKYAGGEISLVIRRQPSEWEICVADQGPGMLPGDRQHLQKRGARRDEQGCEGSGLGLGIVRDIIDSYRGALDFETNDPGGLRVIVHLPLLDIGQEPPA